MSDPKEVDTKDLSRRTFMAASAATAAGLALVRDAQAKDDDLAPEVMPINIALVGCGGRGTGAAENCMESAPGVKLVAMGDRQRPHHEPVRELRRAAERHGARHDVAP